jgi:hypothetical protein
MKFTEAQLESAIIELLKDEGYPYVSGESILRSPQELLVKKDLREYLAKRYSSDGIVSAGVKVCFPHVAEKWQIWTKLCKLCWKCTF